MEEELKEASGAENTADMPDPNTVSSRSLAFLGDAVYELKIRKWALDKYNGKVGELNVMTKELVSAKAQAQIADGLADKLSEEEFRIFKRGRNVKSVPAPHSCSISEYRKATGLEALFGYLYIKGNEERIDELIKEAVGIYESGK